MSVKLQCIRPYFSYCFVLLNNHQYNCNITKSFLSVPGTSEHLVNMTLSDVQSADWESLELKLLTGKSIPSQVKKHT